MFVKNAANSAFQKKSSLKENDICPLNKLYYLSLVITNIEDRDQLKKLGVSENP
jgi:hypothetical protein